ncbi:hypothetical protein SASPL_130478 [Salvia splendens]|uniref:1,4-alpha-D-glucan glucanohydrolase n=1 Tax=Salvia splendens TaxID=180675 RepID=A0A8X8ZJP6_SALSN|nr:hypothetical protein SASPL_130478 [Salvia splendens]
MNCECYALVELHYWAFNWESHKHDWWRNLEQKIPDIAKSGFTSAWLPPPTHSFAQEGYLPQNLYSLNSSYGSENLLKALLNKMKTHKVRAMADIVINHRVGTHKGIMECTIVMMESHYHGMNELLLAALEER